MQTTITLEKQQLWKYLSEFYLDTEYSSKVTQGLIQNIRNCGYDLIAVKRTNQKEVLPVLYANLIQVAGVWTAFDKEWLTSEITRWLSRRASIQGRIKQNIVSWYFADYVATINKDLDRYWSTTPGL